MLPPRTWPASSHAHPTYAEANVGCIPSKALLQSSEHFEHASHHFGDHGIGVRVLTMDLAKMLGAQGQVVKQNNDGILYLLKKNKMSFLPRSRRLRGSQGRCLRDQGDR